MGFVTEGDVSTNNIGLFIQDAWTVNNKLTLNLGLRTESEKVPAYTAGPGIPTYGVEFGFCDKLAPRLGFAYDIKGDGKLEGVRVVGHLLRHLQARAAARLVRRRQVARVLLHARHLRVGHADSRRAARRPARAR